jgi:pimeloyl-ACP methyl ester carboxylesterase
MRERVYTFGDEVRLVGVVSEPKEARAQGELRPAVLLLNAGLLHRAGPARLNVALARQLAAGGFVCLRFDLSGLGDSDTRRDRRSEAERAALDIGQAMESLHERYGAKRFVLIGLCSGADNAHLTAVADERVGGVVLLDPYGYRTTGYLLRHYGPRLLRVAPWLRFVRRGAQRGLRLLRRLRESAEEERDELFERDFAPRDQVAGELQRLLQRGVDHLLVYSGGVREHYFNYRGQFKEMFPRLDPCGRLEVEYFPDADHVYTLLSDRERLIRRICQWAEQRYPATSQ